MEFNSTVVNDNEKLDVYFDVKEIKTIINLKTGQEKKSYRLILKTMAGDEIAEKEISDIDNIKLYEDFKYADALLSERDRKRLKHQIQLKSLQIEPTKVYQCSPGLQKDEDGANLIFVGDELFSDKPIVAKYSYDSDYKLRHKKEVTDDNREDFVKRGFHRYISFWPEVSEMIFYGALYGVLKPYMHHLGLISGFIFFLVAPMGHLKTSMARLYFLWGTKEENLKSTFVAYVQNQKLIKNIKNCIGMCYLLDDLHPVATTNDKKKESQRLDVISRTVTESDDCGHVVMTGESIYDYGTLSCLDRILQVNIPKLGSGELERKKREIQKLDPDFMPEVVRYFQKTLIENYEQVMGDIQSFLENGNNDICENTDSSLRAATHAKYIMLTEFLFRKYCCDSSKELSGYDNLKQTVETNLNNQQNIMNQQRKDVERDYIKDLYSILTSKDKFVFFVTLEEQYSVENEKHCFYKGHNLYFTSKALRYCFCQYLNRTVDLQKIVKSFDAAGILERSGNYYQKKFKGTWHYVISKPMLELYLNKSSASNEVKVIEITNEDWKILPITRKH